MNWPASTRREVAVTRSHRIAKSVSKVMVVLTAVFLPAFGLAAQDRGFGVAPIETPNQTSLATTQAGKISGERRRLAFSIYPPALYGCPVGMKAEKGGFWGSSLKTSSPGRRSIASIKPNQKLICPRNAFGLCSLIRTSD